MRLSLCFSFAAMLLLTSATLFAAPPFFAPAGLDPGARDPATRAQDDFYQYVNGSWLKRTTIPPGQSSVSLASELEDRVETQLHTLLEDAAARSSSAPAADARVGALYAAFIDQSRLDALGISPLRADLDLIAAIRNKSDIATRMGSSQYDFGGSLFEIGIDVDIGNPAQYAIYIGQAGLGMPGRDYYLANESRPTRTAYRAYIERLLGLIQWREPAASADAVLALETRIAEASWTRSAQSDLRRLYNPMSPDELTTLAPGFDWRAFLAAAGLADRSRIVVAEYSALPKLAAIFADTPLETLKSWQAFMLADSAADSLSSDFQQARFEFRRHTLLGQRRNPPRWRQFIDAVSSPNGAGSLRDGMGAMKWTVGELYTARYFSPDTKKMAERMAADIVRAFRTRLETLAWMSPETKRIALRKLGTYSIKLGYPDYPRDTSNLEVRRDDLLGDIRRATKSEWDFHVSRSRGPVDRMDWQITPQTMDAYTGQLRDIVFPAAVMQPPLFDPGADAAVNYASMGTVIARELARGFFDEGRLIDADGARRDWWSPADAAAFKALANALGAQYAAFEPIPGLHIDPQLTITENIADLCGVLVGLDAYHASLNGRRAAVIDGLSGDQRFFIAYAQSWRGQVSDAAIREQTRNDPQSFRKFRVQGPVRNVDAWYAAFNVREGDKMYLAPGDRVRLW